MLIMVNSNTKHFAAQQQCKKNKQLCSHGDDEHVYTVHSYIYANREKIKCFAFPLVTMVTQICHNVMMHVICPSYNKRDYV